MSISIYIYVCTHAWIFLLYRFLEVVLILLDQRYSDFILMKSSKSLSWGFSTLVHFSSVQFSCSVVSDSLRPHGLQHTRLPCPSPTPELIQTHVQQVSDAIQPSHPLSFPSPSASIFPSIRVFFNESVLCIKWPKHWSFSFSISPSFQWIFRTDFL